MVDEGVEVVEVGGTHNLKEGFEVVELDGVLSDNLYLVEGEGLHFLGGFLEELVDVIEEDYLADGVAVVVLEDHVDGPLVELAIEVVLLVGIHSALEHEEEVDDVLVG